MAKCVDNPATGRIGCGQTYTGEMQHSVARVSWSKYEDGRAHITAPASAIEMLWIGDTLRNPVDMGLEQNDRGVWRKPLSEIEKKRLESLKDRPLPTTPFFTLKLV